jgi:hypothetical protein
VGQPRIENHFEDTAKHLNRPVVVLKAYVIQTQPEKGSEVMGIEFDRLPPKYRSRPSERIFGITIGVRLLSCVRKISSWINSKAIPSMEDFCHE